MAIERPLTRQQRRAAERKARKRKPGLASLTTGAALLLGAAGVTNANAAAITVTSAADDVTAGNGQCTLREALTNANTNSDTTSGDCAAGSGADTITFSGTTSPIVLALGQLPISDTVTISGPGSAAQIIDGASTQRIFRIGAASLISATITGVTLQNGAVKDDTVTDGYRGGAIFSYDANLTLNDVIVQNSYAGSTNQAGIGGGIYFDGANAGSLSLTNSTVKNDSARSSSAGASGIGGGAAVRRAPSVTLNNSSFKYDIAAPGTLTTSYGGALDVRLPGAGTLTINGGQFAPNYAGVGGAINLDGFTGPVRIDQSIFIFDFAIYSGGAIQVQNSTDVQITNSAFYYNHGFDHGGAVSISGLSNVTLDNVQIAANKAYYSGGAGLYFSAAYGASLTIKNSTISGNKSGEPSGYLYSANGGGVSARGFSVATGRGPQRESAVRKPVGAAVAPRTALIEDSLIDTNSATGGGGGLFVAYMDSMTVNRTTVTGNTTRDFGGGGIAAISSAGKIVDTTVANNIAGVAASPSAGTQGVGGGIDVINFSLPNAFTIEETTVTGNTAVARGGGVGFEVTSSAGQTISNSILAENTAPTDPDISIRGVGTVSVRYSLIQDPGTLTFTGNGDIIGSSPLLGPLADNGGPTTSNHATNPTRLPQTGSPVIDTGDPAFAPPPATDERALPRVSGVRIDMGAVEVQQALPPGNITVAPSPASGTEGTSVTITLTRTGGSAGAITVNYSTTDVTATSGADFGPTSGSVTFADGDVTPKTITIPLLTDALTEGTETFTLNLTGPSGVTVTPTTVTVSIVDVPVVLPPGSITAAPSPASGPEGTSVPITLTRTGGSAGSITVNYSTASGTATSGADFTPTSGSVTFADGDVGPKTITIPLLTDNLNEGTETFTLNLTGPSGVTVTPTTVTVSIIDVPRVPTLGFWMKLALIFGCAGVGVVVLGRNRLLVYFLVAGLALAATPSLRAAGATQHRQMTPEQEAKMRAFGAQIRARRLALAPNQMQPMSGLLQGIQTKDGRVTVTVNGQSFSVPQIGLIVRDRRKHDAPPQTIEASALKTGAPVVVRGRRAADGSIVRLRVVMFDTTLHAEQAIKGNTK